jgi:hypothetical protein
LLKKKKKKKKKKRRINDFINMKRKMPLGTDLGRAICWASSHFTTDFTGSCSLGCLASIS